MSNWHTRFLPCGRSRKSRTVIFSRCFLSLKKASSNETLLTGAPSYSAIFGGEPAGGEALQLRNTEVIEAQGFEVAPDAFWHVSDRQPPRACASRRSNRKFSGGSAASRLG
jgi:hypothetical protein